MSQDRMGTALAIVLIFYLDSYSYFAIDYSLHTNKIQISTDCQAKRTVFFSFCCILAASLNNLMQSIIKNFDSEAFNVSTIENGKKQVKIEMQNVISNYFNDDVSEKISRITLETSGKFFRATMVFAVCCSLGKTINHDLIKFAACIELIHLSTLIRDDILDGSKTRRHSPTVHVAHGTKSALLFSDCNLLAAISALSADKILFDKTLSCLQKIVVGELATLHATIDANISLQQVFEVAQNKTGTLFGLAAIGSAIICQANEDQKSLIKMAGTTFGTAFQLENDMSSYFSEKEEISYDFINKIISFPVAILLLQEKNEERAETINLLLSNKERDYHEILAKMKEKSVQSIAQNIIFSEYKKYVEMFPNQKIAELMISILNNDHSMNCNESKYQRASC